MLKRILLIGALFLIACNNSEDELEVQETKVEVVENWFSAL